MGALQRHQPLMALTLAVLALGAIGLASSRPALAADSQALLNARCAACHTERADGTLERVHDARKTPEAWDMTMARMMVVHGVKLTSEERRQLVKHLSDERGLAPSESVGYRYVLERSPGVFDSGPDELLTQMCGRCHTFARVALQRRDEAEWLKLVHFHLGQYPTTEYQALGRDRDWFGIATTEVVPKLAELFPFSTPAWQGWQGRSPADLSGTWRVVGHQPGTGDYEGRLTISGGEGDSYSVATELRLADGSSLSRSGTGILFNDSEWRASTSGDDGKARQVLALSEDGNSLSGRWFRPGSDVIGGTLMAAREGSAARVLSVSPSHLKQGTIGSVVISGVGLSGDVDLGPGIAATVTDSSADRITATITVAKDAAVGAHALRVGESSLADAVVVYDAVARVDIEPGQTIARVGDNDGPIAKVPAQFQAVGYTAGADGEAGTDDDVRIGVMPASWAVEDFDEFAAELEDAKFAGTIDQSGLFSPAAAGPNPERRMSTNNAGNLAVIGTVEDGGNQVEGRAQLFVTVQRFVDPPLR